MQVVYQAEQMQKSWFMNRQAMTRKIKTLIHEGYKPKQAIAIAYKYAKTRFLNPRLRDNEDLSKMRKLLKSKTSNIYSIIKRGYLLGDDTEIRKAHTILTKNSVKENFSPSELFVLVELILREFLTRESFKKVFFDEDSDAFVILLKDGSGLNIMPQTIVNFDGGKYSIEEIVLDVITGLMHCHEEYPEIQLSRKRILLKNNPHDSYYTPRKNITQNILNDETKFLFKNLFKLSNGTAINVFYYPKGFFTERKGSIALEIVLVNTAMTASKFFGKKEKENLDLFCFAYKDYLKNKFSRNFISTKRNSDNSAHVILFDSGFKQIKNNPHDSYYSLPEYKASLHLKEKVRGFLDIPTEEPIIALYFEAQNKIRLGIMVEASGRKKLAIDSKQMIAFVEDSIMYLEKNIGGVWKLEYKIVKDTMTKTNNIILDFITPHEKYLKSNPKYRPLSKDKFDNLENEIRRLLLKHRDWSLLNVLSHLLLTTKKSRKEYKYIEMMFDHEIESKDKIK